MIDEGPSAEDLKRFGDDEYGFCPHCGEEVWDDAPTCPSCGEWIEGRAQAKHPETQKARQRVYALIAITLALVISGIVALMRIL